MPRISFKWFVAFFVLLIPVAGYSSYECLKSERRLTEVVGEFTRIRESTRRSRKVLYASYNYSFQERHFSRDFEVEAGAEKIVTRPLRIDPERKDLVFLEPRVGCKTGSWAILLIPALFWLFLGKLFEDDEPSNPA
jgi:hypothetical protein